MPGQDPAVKVKGMHGPYLLPDGTWKRIKDMTPEEKASVHWPAGGD